jgi:hypothetical protein
MILLYLYFALLTVITERIGASLCRLLGTPSQLALILGTITASSFTFLMLALGIGSWASLLYLLIGGSILVLHLLAPRSPEIQSSKSSPLLWAGMAAVWFWLAVITSVPDMHPDALLYNLTGALSWTRSGTLGFNPDQVVSTQCSWWEYLYTLAGGGLALLGRNSLEDFHLLGQWVHLFWGLLPCLMLTAYIAKSVVPSLSLTEQCLIALAVGAVPELGYTIGTAKNDWGVLAWILGGSALLASSGRRQSTLGVLVLAFAASAKFSYLPLWAAAVACLLLSHRYRIELAISLLPILFTACRNWVWTGSPFFPFLPLLFPSELLPLAWSRWNTQFLIASSFWSALTQHLLSLLSSIYPALWIGVALFPLTKAKSFFTPQAMLLPIVLLLFLLVVFLFAGGERIELRHLSVIPLGIAMLGALSLLLLGRDTRYANMAQVLVASSVLPVLLIQAPKFSSALSGASPIEIIESAQSGSAAMFLNPLCLQNPELAVLLVSETRLFYFSNCKVVRAWDSRRIEQILLRDSSLEVLASDLKAAGLRYLLLTRVVIDRQFDIHAIERLWSLGRMNRNAIIFSKQDEYLLDLSLVLAN